MYVGLRQLSQEEWDKYSDSFQPRTPEAGTGQITSPYNIEPSQCACYYRNPNTDTWENDGVTVSFLNSFQD